MPPERSEGEAVSPTTPELARDLRQLEARVDRERVELFKELNRRFDRIEATLEQQSTERITREVYASDQRRLESEMKALSREVNAVKRMFVGGLLTVIAASVLVQAMM